MSELFQDYDWADEVLHARIGREWYVSQFDVDLDVVDYEEHAIGAGSDATAAAYVESIGHSGRPRWGIGLDPNITTASFKAVLGALERQLR